VKEADRNAPLASYSISGAIKVGTLPSSILRIVEFEIEARDLLPLVAGAA
jgi:hypothetical protein